jgi:chromosome segregation ATPase
MPPPTAGDPGAPLDLAPARALSNLAEVNRALQDVAAEERGIDAELDGLLSARAGLERDLARLADQTAEVREERAGLRGRARACRHPCG